MLCERCHKNIATICYAEVKDGQVFQRHLCPECAQFYQTQRAEGFELVDPIPSTASKPKESRAKTTTQTDRTCPHCGISLSRVLELRKVGCATCYQTFSEQIESILEATQAALVHTGKIFAENDAQARLRTEIQTRRALLRSVLRAEQYEEAARIRDEIRRLEAGMISSDYTGD